MITNDLLKGTLRTIILKLLLENGKMYGYEITREVERLSEGKIKLTYGALYPALHKLESERLLSATKKEVDNRLRKYYALTPKGAKEAEALVQEYRVFAATMDALILSKITR